MKLESEQNITPDRWVVIEMDDGKNVFRKVLSGWVGGYLTSDHYRISSPIEKETEKERAVHFETESGSTYICKNTREGMTVLTSGIYNTLKNAAEESNIKVKLVNYGDQT